MKIRIYLGLFVSLICTTLNAQDFKKNLSLGVSVHGTYAAAINTSESSVRVHPMLPQTYKQYNDSVIKIETGRISFGATVWGMYKLNKYLELQAGLSYIDMGFRRIQDDIKFANKLYPGIGRGILEDQSQGSGTRKIEYDYRYQYIQIPVMLNYNTYQSPDFTYNYFVSAGVALNALIDHRITANLYQFSVDGEDRFQLDSTGYAGSSIGMSLLLAFRGEYRIDKQQHFFIQPIFGFSPVSVSSSEIQSKPYYFQLNAGLIYILGQKDEEKK